MSIANEMGELTAESEDAVDRPRRRRSTKHLKANPEPKELRERLRDEATKYVATLDRSRPLSKDEIEDAARAILDRMGLEEKYVGFTMVMVTNAFWKDHFLATPFSRRLLLLPHCLKHTQGCPADYDEFGLDCRRCGACSIADFKTKAEDLGYKVLVAEGTPIVLKIILGGYVDAILGVACQNVLEKSIDKVLLAGVPAYAVPLHSGDCKNTSLDDDWIMQIIDQFGEPPAETRTYVPLMRAANRVFEDDFDRLVPVRRPAQPANDQAASGSLVTGTEQIARDWLRRGGKRFRPFLTLAAFDAVRGGESTIRRDSDSPLELPTAAEHVAVAIEAFHKASLIHDDIEDDDLYRYGSHTLHRLFDVPTAINVGDYLIGEGYRQITKAATLGGDVVADICARMAEAHIRLCEGQGAELLWRREKQQRLTPLEVLKIYALKTSPAFEVAFYAGLRMAGPTDAYEMLVPAFSRHVGIGFQICNDLADWKRDENNKRIVGQDALAMRPTILLSFAQERATGAQRDELESLLQIGAGERDPWIVERLRRLYTDLDVFTTARQLIEKNRARAEALADDVEPTELRELLYYVIDSLLEVVEDEEPADMPLALPIIGVES